MNGIVSQEVITLRSRPWYLKTISSLSEALHSLTRNVQFNSLNQVMLPPNFSKRWVQMQYNWSGTIYSSEPEPLKFPYQLFVKRWTWIWENGLMIHLRGVIHAHRFPKSWSRRNRKMSGEMLMKSWKSIIDLSGIRGLWKITIGEENSWISSSNR